MNGNPKSETSKETKAVVEIIREKLALGEEVSLTVTTGSMRPMLDSGDKIVVRGCLPERLFRGDIILYENGHLLYTHRFLYRKLRGKDNLLITKGDYSTTMDKPFSYDCFLGKIVVIEKRQRRINGSTAPIRLTSFAQGSVLKRSRRTLTINPEPFDSFHSLRANAEPVEAERSRRINLQTRRWKIINWILAMFSMIEVSENHLRERLKIVDASKITALNP